jgi:hypothetical protein
MHLTDGKIDLTRNHEALRVFHDLKPTFEQQIMDQTSNTQAQVSLTERNAAKQPLGRQKKWPVTLPQKLQQTISFKISISFFPALPLKPTEGLAPTIRHYPFTGLAWRMRTLVFSHTSERCTLEWSRATPPSVNLQSSIDDYETKFTKRVLKCIKMCLIQLPITHSTFTRASRRPFELCQVPDAHSCFAGSLRWRILEDTAAFEPCNPYSAWLMRLFAKRRWICQVFCIAICFHWLTWCNLVCGCMLPIGSIQLV